MDPTPSSNPAAWRALMEKKIVVGGRKGGNVTLQEFFMVARNEEVEVKIPREVTSPRSLRAMINLGHDTPEIRPREYEEFLRENKGDEELASRAAKRFEVRRKATLDALMKERDRLIEVEREQAGMRGLAPKRHAFAVVQKAREDKMQAQVARKQEMEIANLTSAESRRVELHKKFEAKQQMLRKRREALEELKGARERERKEKEAVINAKRAERDRWEEKERVRIQLAEGVRAREIMEARTEQLAEIERKRLVMKAAQEKAKRQRTARLHRNQMMLEEQYAERKEAEAAVLQKRAEKKAAQLEAAAAAEDRKREEARERIRTAREREERMRLAKEAEYKKRMAEQEERAKKFAEAKKQELEHRAEEERVKAEARKRAVEAQRLQDELKAQALDVRHKRMNEAVKMRKAQQAREHELRMFEFELSLQEHQENHRAIMRREMTNRMALGSYLEERMQQVSEMKAAEEEHAMNQSAIAVEQRIKAQHILEESRKEIARASRPQTARASSSRRRLESRPGTSGGRY